MNRSTRLRTPGLHRTFATSAPRSRMGANTYAQEWQTGSYHYNKAHTKTFPVAATRTDNLLTAFMTQQKKRLNRGTSETSESYRLFLRNSIAAQRRKTESVMVSKSTAKDFGDRVEVTAFVYDGVEAAEMEKERLRKARMGVKAEGAEGAKGKKRGPVRRRRNVGGSAGVGGGGGQGGR